MTRTARFNNVPEDTANTGIGKDVRWLGVLNERLPTGTRNTTKGLTI